MTYLLKGEVHLIIFIIVSGRDQQVMTNSNKHFMTLIANFWVNLPKVGIWNMFLALCLLFNVQGSMVNVQCSMLNIECLIFNV